MPIRHGIVVLSMLVFGTVVHAGDWQIRPSVRVEEYYSDNIKLSSPGSERHDFVTEIIPSLRIRGEGARLTANVDFRFQDIRYARDSAPRSRKQQLQADATAELVKHIVFVDTRATMRQENVDNTGVVTDDNINVSDNRADVQTFSFSPFFKHRFGTFAESETRYTYDQITSGGASTDSSSNGISLQVNSGRRFTRMQWQGDYSLRKVDRRGGGSDSEFRQLGATARYHFNREWASVLTVGHDRNSFDSSQSSTGGFRWQAGGTWTPSTRTTIEAGWGEQFSGSNFFLDLRHEGRRSIWTAAFSEQITTDRDRQIAREVLPLTDEFGEPIDDPTQEELLSSTESNTLNDDTQVFIRLDTSYAYRTERNRFSLSAFQESRTFQLANADESVFGARAVFSRKLTRQTTARVITSWIQNDFSGGTRTDTTWRSSVTLTHELGDSLQGTLKYAHNVKDSNNVGNEYEENRISAALKMNF